MFGRIASLAASAAFVLLIALHPVRGQELRQNEPGAFDFYVLALSWSPSFCEVAAERGREHREQCGARPFSFVVHGLWPQYEKGFPEYCQVPAPRLNHNIVASMLDQMPSPRLIFHQWDKHGTCSGHTPRAYFDRVRKARAVVKIPPQFIALKEPLAVGPKEVADAFVAANPGLSRAGMAVTCDSRRLHEVRICMTKEFGFRECPDVARRSCRRDRVTMPPMRGG